MAKNLNRLRVLRAERRMTQLTVARRAGVNQSRMSFIENGLVEATVEERKRLARVFGVAVDEAFPEAATA